jgi:osmotically-inducible protein OsmY
MSATPRLPGQKMRFDDHVKRHVEDELEWDPGVDSTDIGVAVNEGVVTLSGFVRSFAHKLVAERAAKRVAGVVGLANDLEVQLPGADERPDPEIARDAVAELKKWLPDAWRHVRPVVEDGWVTLEGEVEWNFQRDYAERALHWIAGIKGISNLIRLRPQVAAAEVRHNIEEAFRRNAQIDANRVTVEASGGEVILGGCVRSWAARQETERAAWAAPGVTGVDNQITVSS